MWDSLGRHGVGSMNGSGQLLLQLHGVQPFHIQHSVLRQTGSHDNVNALLDYVNVRTRDMQDVCNVRTLHGADCWTDHALVRAKIRMVIKPAARSRTIVKLPKRLDVSKLHSAEFQEALSEHMNAVAYTSSWDATKDDLYKVAKETVGIVAAKSRDWFDENDQAISDVLAAIKQHTQPYDAERSIERSRTPT